MSEKRYRYTGASGAYLFGLSHGVNAKVIRGKVTLAEPDGTTVEVQPGDVIVTAEKVTVSALTEIRKPAAPGKAKPAAPAAETKGE